MASHIPMVLFCTLVFALIRLIGELFILSSCGYHIADLSAEMGVVNLPVPGSGLPESLVHRDLMGGMSSGQQLIPRLIHQTYKSHSIPQKLEDMVLSWKSTNPNWEVRLYNDTECLELVSSNFPEYLDAYLALPKNVERADFFRYMVVLLYGGIYADMDTECKRPLDTVIRSRDKLVVGWELEFSSAEQAAQRSYARTRQVLQWVFAAAPAHPVLKEACDLIAANAQNHFADQTDRDTLERTGPGMFTDVVLKHAFDPEKAIRILPRVAFGVNPLGDDLLTPYSPGITVHHHYAGSWKQKEKQSQHHKGLTKIRKRIEKMARKVAPKRKKVAQVSTILKSTNSSLYPVGIPWEPSFVVMVYLKGHGVYAAESDVGADLTVWGNWQAGMDPTRTPRVVDVLMEVLEYDQKIGLIDVGAGLGFFSLAAASRGHPVVAFEENSRDVEALKKGVEYNGFGTLMQVVHSGPEEYGCHGEIPKKGWFAPRYTKVLGKQRSKVSAAASLFPSIASKKVFDTKYLNQTKFGGLRIGVSAAAHTSAVVTAFLDSQFEKKLKVVMIEFMPFVMEHCTNEDPFAVLMMLYSSGYTGVYHAGEICKHKGLQKHTQTCPFERKAPETVKAQVWCKIGPEEFRWLVNSALPGWPENLIFVNEEHFTSYPGVKL